MERVQLFWYFIHSMTPIEPTGISEVGVMGLTTDLTKGVINSMTEIRDCPFCGSYEASVTTVLGYAFVRCYLCGATGEPISYQPNTIEAAKERAIKMWNRRFSDDRN